LPTIAKHPALLGNPQDPANQLPPRFGPKSRLGNYCLWDGFDMVNKD
jgi:hypothetical protein